MEKVWRFGIEQKLELKASEVPAVVLLDSLQQGPKDREIAAEVMFESLGVGGLHCELQQAAALYESGRSTAIVVDVGYGGTRVFAQHAGLPVPCGGVLNLGGQDVDNSIATAMSQLGLHSLVARTASRYDLLTQLKADCCKVNPTKKFGCAPMPYTMNTGLTVMLEAPVQLAPQLLFDPSLAGLRSQSIVDLLMDSINRVEDPRIKETLLRNIVVTGGVSTTQGFCERLASEVQTRAQGYHVGVHAAGGAHQMAVPWIGGSMVGSSPAAVCVSKAGYEEYGMRIVQEAYDWTAAEIATSNCRSRRADDKAVPPPGPDNREDLRQIFNDSPRAPRPTDHQLLARVDTIIATPRNPEQNTMSNVETSAVLNAHKHNLTARGHETLDPKSGTLGPAGVKNAYEMEQSLKMQQLFPPSLEDMAINRPPIPRLHTDHAMTPLVASERAMLGSERLFSPSAACISPRGTALVMNSQQSSSGMPLARFIAAEIDKASPRPSVRAPLDPRIYRQEDAREHHPSLPMSKLWTQGPSPYTEGVTYDEPYAPVDTDFGSYEQRRISKMHQRVNMLGPRTVESSEALRATRPLYEELPDEVVPRSPIFNQRVMAEKQRLQSVVQSGVEMDRILARREGVPVDQAHGPAVPRISNIPSVVTTPSAYMAPAASIPASEAVTIDIRHVVKHEHLAHKHTTGRLWETEAKRAGRHAERSLSPKHSGDMDGNHQRFMARQMAELEKAIAPIDDDDYEAYMAAENKKVQRRLAPDETHPYLGDGRSRSNSQETSESVRVRDRHRMKMSAERAVEFEIQEQAKNAAALAAEEKRNRHAAQRAEIQRKKEAEDAPTTDQSSTGYKEEFSVVQPTVVPADDQQAKEDAYRRELQAKRASRSAAPAPVPVDNSLAQATARAEAQAAATARAEAQAEAARKRAQMEEDRRMQAEAAAAEREAALRQRAQAVEESASIASAKAAKEAQWAEANKAMERERAKKEQAREQQRVSLKTGPSSNPDIEAKRQARLAAQAAAKGPIKSGADALKEYQAMQQAKAAQPRTRTPVRVGRRSSLSEEEKEARRAQQNAELAADKKRKADGPSQYATAPERKVNQSQVNVTDKDAATAAFIRQQESRMASMTADLDDSDAEDFAEMMAAMPQH